MNDKLKIGVNIVKENIKPEFESVWKRVCNTDETPDYQILIWGSTVQDKDREPIDLDIIIEYTGSTIDPDKEKSIESIIKDDVYTKEFSYVDPIVKHRFETSQIISNSRVSEVYSVTQEAWINP